MFQVVPFPAATQHFDATWLHIFLLTSKNAKTTTKKPTPTTTNKTIIKNKTRSTNDSLIIRCIFAIDTSLGEPLSVIKNKSLGLLNKMT